MKTRNLNVLALCVTLFFFSVTAKAADEHKSELNSQEIEENKIQFLLSEVEKSGATFIRNGDEHPAKKARKHLESKMNMARKSFWFFGASKPITAVEFIEKIAASSSTTGEIYRIKLSDGQVVPTEKWLKERLKRFPQKSGSP